MENKRIGIYPGTFDPITFGHLNIIKRSLKLVDEIIVAIANNINKNYMFSIPERCELIKNDIDSTFKNYDNIYVKTVDGLLTDFAKKQRILQKKLNF